MAASTGILSPNVNFAERLIPSLEEMTRTVTHLKGLGYAVVLTSGSFDLIHLGHVKYLEAAKAQGDVLVVGVDSDEKIRRRKGEDRPMVPEVERLELLAFQRPVDLIYKKEDRETRWALIKAVAPDVLVLTEDHSYSAEDLAALEEIVRADRGAAASVLGHYQRADPPDVHEPRRAPRTQACRGPAGADRRHPAPPMSEAVLAYVPVLHEGYRRFLETHGPGRALYLIGAELHAEHRPLAKDIRALRAEHAAAAIEAWGICESVAVLDLAGAERLAAERPALIAPAEDVSYAVVERFFARCEVRYDTVFLRWDKTRTAALLEPEAEPAGADEEPLGELAAAAAAAAG